MVDLAQATLKNSVEITCEWCGKKVKKYKSQLKGQKHMFCSCKCRGEFQKSQRKLKTCMMCGEKYYSKREDSKYCSIECHRQAKKEYMKGNKNHQYGLKGSENATWKSDERISYYGYKLIRCLDHPFKNCDDFVFEHRLVAEEYLLNNDNSAVINGKRYLSPDFVVHHIDFDRLNNNKDNLLVMSEKEHMSMHKKIDCNNEELVKYCAKFNLDVDIIKERRANSPKWCKY